MFKSNTSRFFAALALCLFVFANVTLANEHTNVKEVTFSISNIGSDGEQKVETIVYLLKGVKEVDVNIKDSNVKVKYEPNVISNLMIDFTISSLGYKVSLIDDVSVEHTHIESAEREIGKM